MCNFLRIANSASLGHCAGTPHNGVCDVECSDGFTRPGLADPWLQEVAKVAARAFQWFHSVFLHLHFLTLCTLNPPYLDLSLGPKDSRRINRNGVEIGARARGFYAVTGSYSQPSSKWNFCEDVVLALCHEGRWRIRGRVYCACLLHSKIARVIVFVPEDNTEFYRSAMVAKQTQKAFPRRMHTRGYECHAIGCGPSPA